MHVGPFHASHAPPRWWDPQHVRASPTEDGAGTVAGFLLRLHVGVRGQPGKPPAHPWAGAVEEAPARMPRLALQVHGRRPRGAPSTRREDLPEGPGTAPRCVCFPLPVPGTERTVFPTVSSQNRRTRTRTRTAEHSRGLSPAVSAVSGAHKEMGELGSRVLSQPRQHVGSDARQPRSGPGPSFLTHPPSPSAWTGRPDVLHLWTRTSWSTTGPSTHTPSGQNTIVPVNIDPSAHALRSEHLCPG